MRLLARIAIFAVVSLVVGGVFGMPFLSGRGAAKLRHLPGKMTDGHYQIEKACDVCHTPFGGVKNEACVSCHGAALAAGKDSHPESKFSDPRNADRVAALDATKCSTCHTEHRLDRTRKAGVTLPPDLCGVCHAKIGEERPTHRGFPMTGCAAAGCHNFHDNSGLYEDFLAKHLREPALLAGAPLPAPAAARARPHQKMACGDCHGGGQAGPEFVLKPAHDGCRKCHQPQAEGFDAGRHGMRLHAGLGPMTPAEARLPMRPEAKGKTLGCTSCHDAHLTDVKAAATTACLGCHADEHSRSFPGSSHAAAGLTCATCHMPGGEHDQNANLRPSTKMARGVCQSCHGLGLSLDALADTDLVRRNFAGSPSVHVRTLEMVEERQQAKAKKGKED